METHKPTILVVEDDPAVRHLMVELLSQIGDVVEADDGDAALAVIARAKPAVICLDLSLPQLSGFRVCAAIRQDPNTCDIPVLVVSGRTSVADRAHARESGASEFLSKPFKGRDLLARVEKLLSENRPSEA